MTVAITFCCCQGDMEGASEALQALREHLAVAKESATSLQEARAKRLQAEGAEGTSFAVLEDTSLRQTSSSLSLFSQQIQLIKMVRKRILDSQELPISSSAA